ncbi:MAG: WXG100 family type VII secretion target [bacterium]|nr:WXG100 family type VII secretion target [bacterium]
MKDPYTYIEKDVLTSWGQKMTSLNNEALDIIDKIEAEIKRLNDYWKGNAAEGFTTVNNELIANARKYHNDMKDIESILKEVVITAENE